MPCVPLAHASLPCNPPLHTLALTLVAVADSAEVHVVLVVGEEEQAEPGVEGVNGHDEEDAHDVALLVGAAVAAQVHVDLGTEGTASASTLTTSRLLPCPGTLCLLLQGKMSLAGDTGTHSAPPHSAAANPSYSLLRAARQAPEPVLLGFLTCCTEAAPTASPKEGASAEALTQQRARPKLHANVRDLPGWDPLPQWPLAGRSDKCYC